MNIPFLPTTQIKVILMQLALRYVAQERRRRRIRIRMKRRGEERE